MSRHRLVSRIIALSLALAVLALILLLVGIPAAIIWTTFFKESSRET